MQIAQRNGRQLKCPKCGHNLLLVFSKDVEVDVCSQCKGIWVDSVEEKQFLNIKPEVFTVDELRQLGKLYHPLATTEPVKYFPCPICQELMNRKIWGSHSGIVVDKCMSHGTWFDEDEIEKVQEFIALGGIEFEKLNIAETGLSNLESKLNHEVTRLDLRVDSTYRRARLWSLMGL